VVFGAAAAVASVPDGFGLISARFDSAVALRPVRAGPAFDATIQRGDADGVAVVTPRGRGDATR
jgi:hypothetical protein